MRQDEASKLTLPMNKDELVTCCLLIIHYEELRFLHSMLLLYTLKWGEKIETNMCSAHMFNIYKCIDQLS